LYDLPSCKKNKNPSMAGTTSIADRWSREVGKKEGGKEEKFRVAYMCKRGNQGKREN